MTTLGSIKDEWTFSILAYIKKKLRNRFKVHLDMVIKMYAQKFYSLGTFSFYTAIRNWQTNKRQYCVDL